MGRTPSNVALGRLLAGKEIQEPHSPLVDYPDHVQAIGMISVEIANLEVSLGEFLGSLLHISRTNGKIIYLTPKAAIARLETIENLLSDGDMMLKHGTVAFKYVSKLMARARAVIGRRHEIVHHSWGLMTRESEAHVGTRAMPFKKSNAAKIIPLDELLELVTKIRKLNGDIRAQTDEGYRSWPPYTSQPIPNEPSDPDQSQRPDSPQTRRALERQAPPNASLASPKKKRPGVRERRAKKAAAK